jgi:hypothetical protein
VTRQNTSGLGFKVLTLAARLRAVLAGAGPVARTTPLLGAVVLLAALALIPHGGPAW